MDVNIENYNKGTVVVCILNNRASLTVGKEYTIDQLHIDSYGNEHTVWIRNDDGDHYDYEAYRFVPKSEFRQHIINQILK